METLVKSRKKRKKKKVTGDEEKIRKILLQEREWDIRGWSHPKHEFLASYRKKKNINRSYSKETESSFRGETHFVDRLCAISKGKRGTAVWGCQFLQG